MSTVCNERILYCIVLYIVLRVIKDALNRSEGVEKIRDEKNIYEICK